MLLFVASSGLIRRRRIGGCGSMVEHELPKLEAGVRFRRIGGAPIPLTRSKLAEDEEGKRGSQR